MNISLFSSISDIICIPFIIRYISKITCIHLIFVKISRTSCYNCRRLSTGYCTIRSECAVLISRNIRFTSAVSCFKSYNTERIGRCIICKVIACVCEFDFFRYDCIFIIKTVFQICIARHNSCLCDI